MGNTENEIWSDLQKKIEDMGVRLDALEAEINRFRKKEEASRQRVAEVGAPQEPIDISISDIDLPDFGPEPSPTGAEEKSEAAPETPEAARSKPAPEAPRPEPEVSARRPSRTGQPAEAAAEPAGTEVQPEPAEPEQRTPDAGVRQPEQGAPDAGARQPKQGAPDAGVRQPEQGIPDAGARQPEQGAPDAGARQPKQGAPDAGVRQPEQGIPDAGARQPEPEKPLPKPKKAVMDSRKAGKAVMDVMAEKQSWRTDRPGSTVKNIISAISLNDRVLLINSLFKEDPLLFQQTIATFNAMSSLDEALAYIRENFPQWNLDSGAVYRLMMAVRRKLS